MLFRSVAQQSNVALYNGNDPSFLHYMTYEGMNQSIEQGTHYFRSLGEMIKQPLNPTGLYSNGESDGDLYNLSVCNSFSFPCVFDYLSDLLNGIGIGNSLSAINPVTQDSNLFGGSVGGCGIGQGNHKTAITNAGTSGQQNSCNMGVEDYLLLRQARMALLEKDKVALRLTVPWNSNLAAGKVIRLMWQNKYDTTTPVYGSGEYLIVSLMHTIKLGGFSTTTMDCVSRTVGSGEV